MSIDKEKQDVIVSNLCQVINQNDLSESDTISVLTQFLYSIGASLEGCRPDTDSAEVLKHYYKNPTIGYALMAQAMWMNEVWRKDV